MEDCPVCECRDVELLYDNVCPCCGGSGEVTLFTRNDLLDAVDLHPFYPARLHAFQAVIASRQDALRQGLRIEAAAWFGHDWAGFDEEPTPTETT